MKDYKKFCRPKTTKYPEIGDVQVKLNCGNTVYIKAKDYLGIKKFFKIDSIVGETINTAGNIKVLDKAIDKEVIVSPLTYINNLNKFSFIEIVGNINNSEDGNIICHNTTLNQDAIFSYNDWINLSDDWDLVGLYGITTYEEEDAANGDYVIMANGHTLIIKPEDYSKVSNNWELVDTIASQYDYAGHEYVDLDLPSGTKWATMNVGASNVTDYGSYYQYGKGAAQYAATSGQSDYSGTESPLATTADTAAQEWGGSWHMPTQAQLNELTANTTYEWTTINGVNGGKFTAQNGNYVFFPAAGYYSNGSLVDGDGYVWSSTPSGSSYAYHLAFVDGYEFVNYERRGCGYSVRGVID